MDIRSLEYFVRVAETRSVSRASALLSMTQPALSRHIQRLEEEVGAKLLYRDGRGISLTAAGRALLVHAQAVLEHVQQAATDVASLKGEPAGVVTLAMSPTVSMALLAPLVRELRAKHPKITLRVLERLSGEINEALVNGRVDAAILSQTPATRQRGGEALVVEDLYLIGPARGAGAGSQGDCDLSELSRYPLILPGTAHGLRIAVQSPADKYRVPLNVIVEIDALSTLVRLAEEGIGYTVLPDYVVRREVGLGLVTARRIVNPAVQRTLVLASSSAKMQSPAARALIDLIRNEVAKRTRNRRWLP